MMLYDSVCTFSMRLTAAYCFLARHTSSALSSTLVQDSWAIAKKTARWAQYRCPENFWESSLRTRLEICNRLLFRSILRMCVQNLKFVALPIPEIIGGTSKIWRFPGFAHAPYSPKFLKGFCSHGPCEYITKFEVRSFTRSWDNREYSKNLGSPCIRPRSIFSPIFNRLLFAWTIWIYLPNLTFVALPVPEIIGGTSKIWGVPGFVHTPYSPKCLKGFCSHGPCEYTCQVWSS